MRIVLDKLYEIHKNKDIYPKNLAAAIQLHDQSYKDDGRKEKKDKQKKNEEDADETAGNEDEMTRNKEETDQGNDRNTCHNQVSENGPTITAHMHQEEDNEFKEALLIAAKNRDSGFNMTEAEE